MADLDLAYKLLEDLELVSNEDLSKIAADTTNKWYNEGYRDKWFDFLNTKDTVDL